jgi:hypothetical protein
MLFLGHKNGLMMVETIVEATTTIVEVITTVEVGTTMVEDITIEEEGVVVVEVVCGKISPISSYYDRH